LPTFLWLARFGLDFDNLSAEQRTEFLEAVKSFVEDLWAGQGFRNGLRVKGVRGAPGIFEMTWANDGRATFSYGDAVVEDQAHIVWRRIGTHGILKNP
jgi:hypothetical protein